MKQKITIEEIISRLESQGYKVKKSGNVWRSQCPAHEGEDLNLAFAEGKNDGQIVFTCHSHNCTYEEIVTSLGFEKEEKSKPSKKPGYGGKTIHPTFAKAVSAAAFGAKMQRPPDAVYRYNDLDGGENFSIIRWDTENGKQTRPVSKVDGGYICGTKTDGAYPIYRLPKISEHLKSSVKIAKIYVCEGEKATDTAVSLGLPTTTSAFGSKSATKTDWAAIDRTATKHGVKPEIIILPDNDEPGRRYAESLVEIFTKFKSNPIIKVVSIADFSNITGLSDFPEGGDVHDLCELLDSKTEDEIRNMIEKMAEETASATQINDDNLEWEPFPVDLLPESVARLCKESAAAKNLEPVYVGINSLAVVASVIGSSYKIELKSDWHEPAILWTCLVADSGSGKSPGLDSAAKPMLSMQSEADHEYEQKSDIFETQKDQYNLDYDNWKKRRKRFPPSLPPVRPMEPRHDTFLVDDATLEAIAEVLENNPFGILLVKDELAAWLKSFDCYRSSGGGKDSPGWLSIHGGRPFRVNRKTGKKFIHSDNPAVSLCGGIQPMVLQRIVNDNEDFFDSGLTARILFAMPPDKPMYWSEAQTSDEALSAYENIFRTLYGWRHAMNGPAPDKPLIVRLSAEAKDLFVRFYNSNVDERNILSGDMKAAWAKFTSYTARLALVFHIVERIEDGGSLEILGGDTMQRAVRLIMWFKRETSRILRLLRNTKCEIDFESQAVLEAVEQNGGEMTVRDLQRKRNKYRGRDGSQKASTVLNALVEQGKLTGVTTVSGGKEILLYRMSQTT